MNRSSFETRQVEFQAAGDAVVGVLRVPKGAGQRPAVVFDGPLTSVKEQVTGNYATAFAERGYVTLAIDHRHFGQSGGTPREYEHPGRKVEDLKAALTYLEAQPEVDGSRLAIVGVCAGAGYASNAVAEDSRVRAFGTVAGFFHDNEKQREWMGDKYDAALQRAVDERLRFEAGGECAYIPAVGDGEVAMPLAEASEYYGTARGAVDNYTNRFAVMSREHTLPWDAQAAASSITVPTMMVHSDNALAPALAKTFYAQLAGPKEQHWVQSKGQIDFYDDPALIAVAVDALEPFFSRVLG